MSLDVWLIAKTEHTVFDYNITHNLNEMAAHAGLYYPLWRPEEIGVSKAAQLVPHLRAGLRALRRAPDYFEKLNPENGWGSYSGLVKFVEDYLMACERHPEAQIGVSR